MLMDRLTIKLLESNDIDIIVDSFSRSNWTIKLASTFNQYLDEQHKQERIVWLAYFGNNFAGYVTLKWQSNYPNFNQHNIPEINDLNVLPDFRNNGAGTSLLKTAEDEAFKKSDIIGLGVGLYADYGNAQKLYVKHGYIPDGNGLTYENRPAMPGASVLVDDELLIWMVKQNI